MVVCETEDLIFTIFMRLLERQVFVVVVIWEDCAMWLTCIVMLSVMLRVAKKIFCCKSDIMIRLERSLLLAL
jgi:hypothetical protein